jgi:hypothetical protein
MATPGNSGRALTPTEQVAALLAHLASDAAVQITAPRFRFTERSSEKAPSQSLPLQRLCQMRRRPWPPPVGPERQLSGGRNRQISLHREQLPQVRHQLRNFHQLKKTLESSLCARMIRRRPPVAKNRD